MTSNELIEYIDHVVSSINSDYTVIHDQTNILRDAIERPHKDRVDWNLVHIHTSLNTFLTDLKRHQQYLKKGMNASTTL